MRPRWRQDDAKTCQVGAKMGHDGANLVNIVERARRTSERSERCERSAKMTPSRAKTVHRF